jgi:hypothetical protein
VGQVDTVRHQVVFSWTNPDPRPGDQYHWYLDPLDDQVGAAPGGTTSTPQATVPLPEGADVVCINVRVVRDAQGSFEKEGCVPL